MANQDKDLSRASSKETNNYMAGKTGAKSMIKKGPAYGGGSSFQKGKGGRSMVSGGK